MRKVFIVFLSFVFNIFLAACATSPAKNPLLNQQENKSSILLEWQYEGLEKQKVTGKVVRVWLKSADNSQVEDPQFAILEVIKGIDKGQFHIGFFAKKSLLGILNFYEYDQRHVVNIAVDGIFYKEVSLRRIRWDKERDFIGFLDEGTSLESSQNIYDKLRNQAQTLQVSLILSGGKKTYSFDLKDFQKQREEWMPKVKEIEGKQ